MHEQKPGVYTKRHQHVETTFGVSLKTWDGLVVYLSGKDINSGVLDHCGLNARPTDFGNECHHKTHLARWASPSSVVICPGSNPDSPSAAASIKCPEHPSSRLYSQFVRSYRLCSQMPFWREASGEGRKSKD